MTIYRFLGIAAAITSLFFAGSGSSTASCASRKLHEAEVAMNETFRQLLFHTSDPKERKQLIAEQSAWIEARKESVREVSRTNPHRLDWREHKIAMTRERLEILQCMLIALSGKLGVPQGPPPKLARGSLLWSPAPADHTEL